MKETSSVSLFVNHRVQIFVLLIQVKKNEYGIMGKLLHLDRKIARLKTKVSLIEAKWILVTYSAEGFNLFWYGEGYATCLSYHRMLLQKRRNFMES